jgi:predicted Zn-dependent protease
VRVAIKRDGVEQALMVKPVMACAIPINYVPADDVNAHTDGEKIVIYSGIVRAAQTDAQLANVIGHELAHANLGHNAKKGINMVFGMATGLAIDAGFAVGGIYTDGTFTRHLGNTGYQAYSVEFEREADYVGAYYTTRAGYDLAGTEEFWREVGITHPDSIRFAKTHPTTPVRFVQMREVATEIRRQEAPALAAGAGPEISAAACRRRQQLLKAICRPRRGRPHSARGTACRRHCRIVPWSPRPAD